MTASAVSRRRGLTLVEVLVVIAVIGILVGLLLPAVMQARSSGRRSQCANNLKQLGVAVQQFHQRNGTLPVYWGAMNNRGSELFGPWVMYLLPDLGEQPFYDVFQPSPATGVVVGQTVRGAEISPAVPASPDYSPGTPKTELVDEINMVGIVVKVVKTTYEGQTGTPAQPAEFEYTWQVTGTVPNTTGLHPSFGAFQQTKALEVLQCSDDTSAVPPNSLVSTSTGTAASRNGARWSTTNYVANAHVFMKFNGPRILNTSTSADPTSSTMAGRYPRAKSSWTGNPDFTHLISGTRGLAARQFAHIVDGLSNTMMFGEVMRQCDDDNARRYAFLPTAEQGEEHPFGIDLAISRSGTGATFWGDFAMAYGNTLMFQQRPPAAGCNKYRLQANHEVLNVVMCDGSVRGISPRVTRREQCDPDVAGREYGRDTYNPLGLGAVSISGTIQYQDGIWDMLMVPNDPPGNVLANTGEIGKEK